MENKLKRGIDPAILKGLTIFLLVMLLLIPLGLITKTIDERRIRNSDTEQTLLKEYGGEQIVNGPMLVVPYIDTIYNKKNEIIEENKHVAYFFPESLRIESSIEPDIRNRGIYRFLLYKGDINFSGSIKPDFNKITGDVDIILWDEAYLELEISDMKGLTSRPEFNINGNQIHFESELTRSGIFTGGVSSLVDISETNSELSFNGGFSIQGGRSISFIPLGKENSISINSSWDNPSFFGAYLPKDKKIEKEKGFESNYYIMGYNSDYKSQMTDSEFDKVSFYNSYFGVKLLFPVDIYLLTQRSVKYGLLFIVLPFLVFFLFEIFSRIKVHPFHYLFVGITSSLFFLLLVAISEQFSFVSGYLFGAISVAGLITYYSCYFLKSIKRGILIFPIMVISYFFMYLMINSQDYALLIGSIGLFVIVGGVMVTTRNVDWYNLGGKSELE